MGFDLCAALGIQYPILKGAMTGFSNARLTAAVSEAGALGVFAAGMHVTDIGAVREGIQEVKHLTGKPFGVNVPIVAPIVDELMDYLCREEVAVVTTGAGSPAKWVPQLREANVRVIPVIASVHQAVRMEEAGAWAVVAEGMESGGNAGKMCTMPLVPQVADAVKIPVIAAGGITDGRGMAAAFVLGACGIQMGTRFMMTAECEMNPKTREFLLSRSGSDTVVIGQKIGNKINPRCVMCPAVQKILDYETRPNVTIPEFQKFFRGRTQKAIRDGDLEEGFISAGQGIGQIHETLTCAQVVEKTMREFHEVCAAIKELC